MLFILVHQLKNKNIAEEGKFSNIGACALFRLMVGMMVKAVVLFSVLCRHVDCRIAHIDVQLTKWNDLCCPASGLRQAPLRDYSTLVQYTKL